MSDFQKKIYFRPKLSKKSYHMQMKALQDSLAVEMSDVAAFRIHVITHYYHYGLKPTLDAFNLKKTTFHTWKRTYEKNGSRVIALVPKKTRPHHTRQMQTDWRLIDFIREMRQEHGNIGKNVLKPFVDAYAQKLGIETIGPTTIQKIITRRHLTFEKKVYTQKPQNKFKKAESKKIAEGNKSWFYPNGFNRCIYQL